MDVFAALAIALGAAAIVWSRPLTDWHIDFNIALSEHFGLEPLARFYGRPWTWRLSRASVVLFGLVIIYIGIATITG